MRNNRFLIALAIAVGSMATLVVKAQAVDKIGATAFTDWNSDKVVAYDIVAIVPAEAFGISDTATVYDLRREASTKGYYFVPAGMLESVLKEFDKSDLNGQGSMNIATEPFSWNPLESELWIYSVHELGMNDKEAYMLGREFIDVKDTTPRYSSPISFKDAGSWKLKDKWVFLRRA